MCWCGNHTPVTAAVSVTAQEEWLSLLVIRYFMGNHYRTTVFPNWALSLVISALWDMSNPAPLHILHISFTVCGDLYYPAHVLGMALVLHHVARFIISFLWTCYPLLCMHHQLPWPNAACALIVDPDLTHSNVVLGQMCQSRI